MKNLTIVFLFLCTMLIIVPSNVIAYSFNDTIDLWEVNGELYDSIYLDEDMDISNVFMPNSVQAPYTYTHDINQEVDLAAGHYVTEAYLELDFTDMDVAEPNNDTVYFSLFCIEWSRSNIANENVQYYLDDTGNWIELGEIDTNNDVISALIVNVDWLNDDGFLDVTVNVTNNCGVGDIGLDSSKLYGTAEVAPVPEPATMLLIGTGLIGFAGIRRKKIKKQN